MNVFVVDVPDNDRLVDELRAECFHKGVYVLSTLALRSPFLSHNAAYLFVAAYPQLSRRPVQCTRAGGVFKCTYIGVDVRIDPTHADARMTGLLRSVLTLVFRRCLRQPNNIWGNRTPGSSIRLSTQGAESDYMETSNYLHIHILSLRKAGVKNNLTNVSLLGVRIGRSMIKTLAVLLHNRVMRVKKLLSTPGASEKNDRRPGSD